MLFLMGFKRGKLYTFFWAPNYYLSRYIFYMSRFNFGKISDWQTRAMGLRQPHPSFTAVCSGLLYRSRAPQRRQAAKPKIFPIHSITDPYFKVISRGDREEVFFPLFSEFGGLGDYKGGLGNTVGEGINLLKINAVY